MPAYTSSIVSSSSLCVLRAVSPICGAKSYDRVVEARREGGTVNRRHRMCDRHATLLQKARYSSLQGAWLGGPRRGAMPWPLDRGRPFRLPLQVCYGLMWPTLGGGIMLAVSPSEEQMTQVGLACRQTDRGSGAGGVCPPRFPMRNSRWC